MTATPNPHTLPAEHLVPAWRNAFTAASNDDSRTALYRTVRLEWYDTGIRFIATDSSILVESWAAASRDFPIANPPQLDEAPNHTLTAIAADRIMVDFLKHRATEIKQYNRDTNDGLNPDPIDVTLSVGTIDDPDTGQQTLDVIGPQQHLIISSPNERIALPIYDGDYPAWRVFFVGGELRPVTQVETTPDVLSRIGQLDTLPMDEDDSYLTLGMAGTRVIVTGTGRVPLTGLFVPRATAAAEEAA